MQKCDQCQKLKLTKSYKVRSNKKTEDGKTPVVFKNYCDGCAEGFGKAFDVEVLPKG